MMEEIIKHMEKIDKSPDFARIINTKNWLRLDSMIERERVIFGGETNAANLYISPTLIEEPELDSPVMKEEILDQFYQF